VNFELKEWNRFIEKPGGRAWIATLTKEDAVAEDTAAGQQQMGMSMGDVNQWAASYTFLNYHMARLRSTGKQKYALLNLFHPQ
jgi:hypothetical protein